MSAAEHGQQFFELLAYLKHNRCFDFSGYKRASLERRIQKRMQAVNLSQYHEYIDYLEVHPDEFFQLFNTILINLTGFFRDPEAWEVLAEQVIPRLATRETPEGQVRVWCAGCASGEEAYSAAMLLCEAMGATGFREGVKLYATDLDEEALIKARRATYTPKEMEGVPQELCQKYFEQTGGDYTFRNDLRRSLIFGRHDLIRDAPISRVDLLVCRNILMYFNAETQQKVVSRLNFAIREGGYLFLGKAETLLSQGNTLTPVDLKRRIFMKTKRTGMEHNRAAVQPAANHLPDSYLTNLFRLKEAVFDKGPEAQLVVERGGALAMLNERARVQFGLTNRALGQPIQDLELSYRPVELRSPLQQVYHERREIILKEVEWEQPGGGSRYYNVQVVPLISAEADITGASITFADVTTATHLKQQLEHTNKRLETAMEELQSTNEELETTNEELQSTIEELETTNEELKSTNEELETMNEELQSTNQEMETINEELQLRTQELQQIKLFLESILANLSGGVVVVDNDLRVQIWNQQVEELWGLRSREVLGANLLDLDIGLPVEQLKEPLQKVLDGESESEEVTVQAVNRRGRSIRCHVRCAPLLNLLDLIQGAILVMDSDEN
jgi:two-component system, chemotaxis family, CheB/CheR fusion protein